MAGGGNTSGCAWQRQPRSSWPGRPPPSGGNYVFDGGTAYEQQQVRQALAASSFNWSVIPGTITVHITPDFTSEAIPGAIFLDPELLDSGEFAWGVVQHEYAHEVDFALFDDATHAALTTQLGATAWCYGNAPTLAAQRVRLRALRLDARLGLLAVARELHATVRGRRRRVGSDGTRCVPRADDAAARRRSDRQADVRQALRAAAQAIAIRRTSV